MSGVNRGVAKMFKVPVTPRIAAGYKEFTQRRTDLAVQARSIIKTSTGGGTMITGDAARCAVYLAGREL